MESSLFHAETTQPLASYGIHGVLFEFDTETVLYTWIALGIITLFALIGRWTLRRPHTVAGQATLTILKSFKHFIVQSTNGFESRYYFFITALFIFIFVCNALVLIPGLEEPTKNLNTTFALAFIAFFYVQRELFKTHGLVGYLQEYFKTPFSMELKRPLTIKAMLIFIISGIANIATALFSFPIEMLSKIATILSLSLRLFGNIFGSSIMIDMFRQATLGSRLTGVISVVANYHLALGILFAPLLLIVVSVLSLVISFGFGVLESLVQAFVFSILTLTYIALATQHEEQPRKEHR